MGEVATILEKVGFKLKTLKRPLKSLCKEKFSNIERKVIEANEEILSLQLDVLNQPSASNVLLERDAREKWLFFRQAEESFFRQRSRIKWLEDGDFDTKFFHFVTKARNASNAIKYLRRVDGSKTNSLQEVHSMVVSYYAGIYNTLKGDFCPFLPLFLDSLITQHCPLVHQQILKSSFSVETIRSSLFKMPLNRTPGPDGFPVEFFTSCWEIIGVEVTMAVQDFFSTSFMPKALNLTMLVLIPK